MSLTLKEIQLTNFRNHKFLNIKLDENLTIFVGENAAGKTNTLEAIQLLTSGRSFKNSRSRELIQNGYEQGKIKALIEGDGRLINTELNITPDKKQFSKNGKKCSPSEISGDLVSILFTPDDLSFIKGSAGFRRSELDYFASQINKGYGKVLSSYTRSVEQRNKLLKDKHIDSDLLDAWDESLAVGAATILQSRVRLLDRLKPYITNHYQTLTSKKEKIDCEYISSITCEYQNQNRNELSKEIEDKLKRNREEDLERQQTCIGPHRDDIQFSIEGKDMRVFGSQGQQRSAVIAWKMAEVEVTGEISDSKPLLLLDDVMSELDEKRRRALSDLIKNTTQTVITTTNLGYFSSETLTTAKVVDFNE